MKKLLFFLSTVVLIALASCSGKNEAEKIFGKIQAGDEISQEECHFMIEYLEHPLVEAVDIIKDTSDLTEIQEKLTKINEKYPYVQPFTEYLSVHYYDLDKENQEEFGEITQKLQRMLR